MLVGPRRPAEKGSAGALHHAVQLREDARRRLRRHDACDASGARRGGLSCGPTPNGRSLRSRWLRAGTASRFATGVCEGVQGTSGKAAGGARTRLRRQVRRATTLASKGCARRAGTHPAEAGEAAAPREVTKSRP